MDPKILAKYLDFANHHQNATEGDIKKLCEKVVQYGFHSAFVNPYFVPLVKELLQGKAATGTVVSFPLGQESQEIKVASGLWAVQNGADELDVSMNVGVFKEGHYKKVLEEMKAIVSSVKTAKNTILVKFIIETGCLTDDEIKKASELVLEASADFVKTCSGMGPRGGTIHDVELIKSVVGDRIKIKVAGGVTNYQQTIDFINVGASRLGTSHAVEIVSNISSSESTGE
ncbi:deoxyribose-phosphate aldolase [Candidatus Roizmanbacteria bacterium]|nr:deoxyribose-phosphate aldolase [Candidatus Roizmanbacteria bacterium]